MKTILKPRGAGKSTELIKQSASSGDTIVCMDVAARRAIITGAINMELTIPRPITHKEFLNNDYRGIKISGLLIDDVDLLLQSTCDFKINAVSITIP